MLPTPSTSHVNYNQIYEPAEDSFLLLDTLSSQSEVQFLRDRLPSHGSSPLVVEIGTGSGVVLGFLTANALNIFARHDVASMGIDINFFACQATAETVRGAVTDNKTTGSEFTASFLDSITGDLTASFRQRSIDILIFNPPYVPTEVLPARSQLDNITGASKLSSSARFERDSYLLSLSYAGGVNGMETTNRLLEQLPEILSDRGVAYILLCAQNKPEEVADTVRAWPENWSAEKVGFSGKTAGWEKLCILRIWRGNTV